MPNTTTTPPTSEAEARQQAEALLQAGLAASQDNDSEKALELFAQASAAYPASGLPHFLAGSEYAALGQVDKAEGALANAVLLAPDFHIARYQLGLLQFSSGRAASALVTWQPLFSLEDTQALGHFVRGFAALAQDDFAGAKAHFDAGLVRNTDNAALSADIQKVLQGMGDALAQGPSEAPPAPAESNQAAAHILLSNYGKFGGTLH
jgi:tetratricopeptide (TPR) repeat protein